MRQIAEPRRSNWAAAVALLGSTGKFFQENCGPWSWCIDMWELCCIEYGHPIGEHHGRRFLMLWGLGDDQKHPKVSIY